MLNKLLENESVSIIISIILGLGLASLFRQVCKGNECIIIKGPSIKEVSKKVYKIDDKCYKYTPKAMPCSSN
tara:strand:- start:12186 stop:12401 length:216 start_codon:yes stop_codon:yes gene_type:complete